MPPSGQAAKTACQNKADAAGTFARCELASAVSGTQREKAAQDRSNAALGETCIGTATECFVKRKAALGEVSGAQTLTDTDVKMKLKNIAAEKASGAMDACRIDFTKTKDVIERAHANCFTAAKKEYTKFDSTGAEMSDEELGRLFFICDCLCCDLYVHHCAFDPSTFLYFSASHFLIGFVCRINS